MLQRFNASTLQRLISMIFFIGSVTLGVSQNETGCGTPDGGAAPPSGLPEEMVPSFCTNSTQDKYVRVHYTFVLKDDGTGNFDEISDGNGYYSYNGYQRAEEVISQSNYELANNLKMWLPGGNTTPNPPNKLRYLLAGVHFVRSTALWNGMVGSYTQYEPFLKDETEAINIFSVGTLSNGTCAGCFDNTTGVANAIGAENYMLTLIRSYTKNYLPSKSEGVPSGDWHLRSEGSLVNHEIGHLLGLRHTWNEVDGCDDTPMGVFRKVKSSTLPCPTIRINCWRHDPDLIGCTVNDDKPCDEYGVEISNNVMDYNQYDNHAYSPCQLGIIAGTLKTNTIANAAVYSCDGCAPAYAKMTLPPLRCTNNVEMQGSASVNEERWKVEICEVSAFGSATCVANTEYTSSIRTSKVGNVNLSSLYQAFQINKVYRVRLTVFNDCTSSHFKDGWVQINGQTNCAPPPGPIFGFATVAPNPTGGHSTFNYQLNQAGNLSLWLANFYGAPIQVFQTNQPVTVDPQSFLVDLSNQPNGVYRVIAQFNGQTQSFPILKQNP